MDKSNRVFLNVEEIKRSKNKEYKQATESPDDLVDVRIWNCGDQERKQTSKHSNEHSTITTNL